AGYVTNVGRISHQKSGSRTLDFSLANGRQAIRVTLWGALGDTLVERKTNKILDDAQIPALHALLS
nr:replication protein A 70 kDa DNA-binding subunit C-like [Tanacetum cinerariifolium]